MAGMSAHACCVRSFAEARQTKLARLRCLGQATSLAGIFSSSCPVGTSALLSLIAHRAPMEALPIYLDVSSCVCFSWDIPWCVGHPQTETSDRWVDCGALRVEQDGKACVVSVPCDETLPGFCTYPVDYGEEQMVWKGRLLCLNAVAQIYLLFGLETKNALSFYSLRLSYRCGTSSS